MNFLRTITIALLALTATASTAQANDYWVELSTARGEIAQGVNGFTWSATGGNYSVWGSHCDALPGSYIAGSYCRLRFNVPGGLSVGAVSGGGIARGTFRTANDYFVLRSERPGGNPANIVDSPGDGAFAHGWGALGSYFELGLRTNAATNTTSSSNWFGLDTFTVLMHDPSAPTVAALSAPGGWLGGGCHAITYGFSDSGSQMWSTSLTDLTSGATIHSWAANPGRTVIQSGIPTAVFTPCISGSSTGAHTLRIAGADRSGAGASSDFTLHFDLTPPDISSPTVNGGALGDGTTITGNYRPAVNWNVSDAHSGIASITTRIDQTPVSHQRNGASITLALQSDLPLGDHQLAIDVVANSGNVTTVSRHVRVIDTTTPTINVAQPGAIGGNNPLLDATAADDRSGINVATWTVRVNDEPLLINATSARVQAEIGYLIAGTHTIELSVADGAGNTAHTTLRYTVSNPAGTTIPGLTGLYILDAPDTINQGEPARVRAAAVRNGRPLAGMRAELHQGTVTIAGKPIASDGTVDIAMTLNTGEPVTLTVNGSGFPDQPLKFQFVARTPAPDAAAAAATSPTAVAVSGAPQSAAAAGSSAPNPASSPAAAKPTPKPIIVSRVIDGDTIQLTNGQVVRLLQVDAPEATECFGGRATAHLRALLKPKTRVTLTADTKLGLKDDAGNLLRYVNAGRIQINRTLVLRGAAAPYFAAGTRGRLASQLLSDVKGARAAKRGMWSACPGARLTPVRGASTGPT